MSKRFCFEHYEYDAGCPDCVGEMHYTLADQWRPLIGYTIHGRYDGETLTHIVARAKGLPDIELWALPKLGSGE